MQARLRRLFEGLPKELSWRANLMLAIVGLYGVVILGQATNDLWSPRVLYIMGITVAAIGFLLYFPRMALLAGGAALCVYLSRSASHIQNWQTLVVPSFLIFLLTFWYLAHSIYRIGEGISGQISELHQKMDDMQEKLEEIEAKQDELA
jgi:hypothetical protein